jgi:hypothetical protein
MKVARHYRNHEHSGIFKEADSTTALIQRFFGYFRMYQAAITSDIG